jgi:hypothetical protein
MDSFRLTAMDCFWKPIPPHSKFNHLPRIAIKPPRQFGTRSIRHFQASEFKPLDALFACYEKKNEDRRLPLRETSSKRKAPSFTVFRGLSREPEY